MQQLACSRMEDGWFKLKTSGVMLSPKHIRALQPMAHHLGKILVGEIPTRDLTPARLEALKEVMGPHLRALALGSCNGLQDGVTWGCILHALPSLSQLDLRHDGEGWEQLQLGVTALAQALQPSAARRFALRIVLPQWFGSHPVAMTREAREQRLEELKGLKVQAAQESGGLLQLRLVGPPGLFEEHGGA